MPVELNILFLNAVFAVKNILVAVSLATFNSVVRVQGLMSQTPLSLNQPLPLKLDPFQ